MKKSLLSILLAVGISSLAYANQERRPEPRAPEAKTTQKDRKATLKIFSFFFAPAIQTIGIEPDGPCDGRPQVCTVYGCNCGIGPPPEVDPQHPGPLPPSNPPPD